MRPPSTLAHLPFAQPLVVGRFLRRYKRFFVDVEIDGDTHTAHTANTGAMTGLLTPGAAVVLTRHEGTKRALPLEVEAIALPRADATLEVDDVIGATIDADEGAPTRFCLVNTIRANRVAAAFVDAGVLPGIGRRVTGTEARVPPHLDVAETARGSRFDLEVDDTTLVEVKSVTLRVDRAVSGGTRPTGSFPDAVSERARKHIALLERVKAAGHAPTALLYLCQRDDVDAVEPAWEIDRAYADAVAYAAQAGVQVSAVVAGLSLWRDGDVLVGATVCRGVVPVDLSPPSSVGA